MASPSRGSAMVLFRTQASRVVNDSMSPLRSPLVEQVSPLLPTRALADVLAAAAVGAGPPWRSWAALAGFATLFAVAAVWGYRRDEGQRYR